MRTNRYNSIGVLFLLPLALFLWQGSSCRSSNANSNGNPSMNANTSTATQSRDLRGTWGAQGIAMEVTDAGATIEYDCAHGRITGKLLPTRTENSKLKGFTSASTADRRAMMKITGSRPSTVVRSKMKR